MIYAPVIGLHGFWFFASEKHPLNLLNPMMIFCEYSFPCVFNINHECFMCFLLLFRLEAGYFKSLY